MLHRSSLVTAVRRAALVVALLASASCGTDDGFWPKGEQLRLAAASVKWIDRAPSNYSYSVRIICFCFDRPDMRVTVVNGSVTSVRPVGGGPEEPADVRAFFGPMQAMFGIVSDGLDRDPYWMQATYDPAFGFPVDVFFDFERNVADEEWGFRVLDFTEG